MLFWELDCKVNWFVMFLAWIKFIYSEKATKLENILQLNFDISQYSSDILRWPQKFEKNII